MYNKKRMSEIIVNAKTLCVLMRLRRAGRVPQSGKIHFAPGRIRRRIIGNENLFFVSDNNRALGLCIFGAQKNTRIIQAQGQERNRFL